MKETPKSRGRSGRTRGKGLARERALIDSRSEILITEFFAHRELAVRSGVPDGPAIFESWAIQKIAGLQVLLLERARGAA